MGTTATLLPFAVFLAVSASLACTRGDAATGLAEAGAGGSSGAASGGGGSGGAAGRDAAADTAADARSDGGRAGEAGAGGTGGAGGGGAPIVIPGSGNCTAPTGARVEDARAAYAKWKTDLLTSSGAGGFLRVRRPNSAGAQVNSTVSEGIAYGMLLAAYMDDQPVFDSLWRYSQLWINGNGLMDWYINAEGTARLGTGAATDSDEDIAFALVVADARWGGRGSLAETYLALARRQIGLIWAHEVDHGRGDVLMAGDQFNGGEVINISYFAPAFYRVFGRITGATADWQRVVESTYTVLGGTLNAQNRNATNGLVPAWSTPAGMPMAPPGTGLPTHHQLDSCRTPFRIAQDYCWFGEPRALDYLQKITAFYAAEGARNLVDGYNLDGTRRPEFVTGAQQAASFVGPAAVGAMAIPAHAALRDEGYAAVASLMLLAGSQYYQESWTALSLLMLTGGFTPPPP